MDKNSLVLAERQRGLCPLCKQALIAEAEYEPDSPRECSRPRRRCFTSITSPTGATAAQTSGTTFASCTLNAIAGFTHAMTVVPQHAVDLRSPWACLSRMPRKEARPVLWGPDRGDAIRLPDSSATRSARSCASTTRPPSKPSRARPAASPGWTPAPYLRRAGPGQGREAFPGPVAGRAQARRPQRGIDAEAERLRSIESVNVPLKLLRIWVGRSTARSQRASCWPFQRWTQHRLDPGPELVSDHPRCTRRPPTDESSHWKRSTNPLASPWAAGPKFIYSLAACLDTSTGNKSPCSTQTIGRSF